MALPIVATMASGSLWWNGWTGWLPSLQDQVEATLRPGAAGTVSQLIGFKAEITAVKTWRAYEAMQLAYEECANVERFQGYVVDVVDPWTRTFSRVRIHSVRARVVACRGPGELGGQALARMDVDWMLEPLVVAGS